MPEREGCHLILDGETEQPLTVTKVERFLRHYPRFIGMQRITEPVVIVQRGGCCGIVIIAESHVSIHSRERKVMVDVFSCVGLDVSAATKGLVRLLGLVEYDVRAIPRPMPAPAIR